ncbi:MAG: dihydrodipicolinate synthase family protein [Defluviicoccus sp.]|nr:dihydrodipicolinate synthase family protein [Defluviicoccus sp.]
MKEAPVIRNAPAAGRTAPLSGVLAAVLTPLDDLLAPDHELLIRHCRWLLGSGCTGLSVLGTTGEANSFSVDERLRLLDALAEGGLPGSALLPGTGTCAVPDTVRLTLKAIEIGAGAVLMLPPFYYKNVSDDGIFAAYAQVIERVGDARLRICLYHFPQMSGVALGPALIERLLKHYPGTIAGIKDSSGDGAGMVETARRFPQLSVLTGSDAFLFGLLENGGAGCITACCNIAGHLAADVVESWRRGEREAAVRSQERLDAVRAAVTVYPMTAALKALMVRHSGRPHWRNIRPPLVSLTPQDAAALESALHRLGFVPAPWL